MFGGYRIPSSRSYRGDMSRENYGYTSYDRPGMREVSDTKNATGAAENSILKEAVDKVKLEADELKELVIAREDKISDLEAAVQKNTTDTDNLLKKVSMSIREISEQMEDMEVALTETFEKNREKTSAEISKLCDPLAEKCERMTSDVAGEIDELKKSVHAASAKADETYGLLDSMNSKLDEKAEKKSLSALHQRLTVMFAIGIADMIGSIMTLALLCYLIISISR